MMKVISALLLLSSPTMAQANLFRGGDVGYSKAGTRIIGGDRAEEDRYPYAVSMQDGGGHFCGGTLIGRNVVVTAAHCLGGSMKVVIGSDDVDSGESISVARQLEHPDYNSGTDENDVGLLFLSEPTSLNIPFPRLNDDPAYPPIGSTSHTMGWGDTDAGDSQKLSDRLMITDLRVISNDECGELERSGESYNEFKYDITRDMICTYTSGQDACQGDSGGPLIIRNGSADNDVLIGIVSWGVGCAYLPGVFARVSEGFDWMERTVCSDPDLDAPTLCAEPTSTPTQRPTLRPTQMPTNNPTRSPTKRPTENPTTSPSVSPTSSPTTAEPTVSPTESPTSQPSLSSEPTGSPSLNPTLSFEPSSSPTDSPSISQSPSESPSASPTTSAQPTQSPSISTSPSVEPTYLPTVSHQPTVSFAPTDAPSSLPSSAPSSMPSLQPSSQPSVSSQPTESAQPTMAPSESVSPTSAPSKAKPAVVFGGTLSLDISNALLIPDQSVVADQDGVVADEGKEARTADSSSNAITSTGAMVLSGIISLWMVL